VTPDTCEAGKETTTALMKILPFGGGASSQTVQERSVSDWRCNTGKAQLAEPKLTLMIL